VTACHDLSDGGLLVALAEMALAGNLGAEPTAEGDAAFWFGEDQGRYLVTLAESGLLLKAAEQAGIPARRLGRTTAESTLTVPGARPISLQRLREAHEGWLPAYMDAP
jgi:phosphoribosylformylglycinamidine synthase